jgi:hypothetical protein
VSIVFAKTENLNDMAKEPFSDFFYVIPHSKNALDLGFRFMEIFEFENVNFDPPIDNKRSESP